MSDLATLYLDLQAIGMAVSARFGADETAVILDRPDTELLGGYSQSTDYQIRYQTARWPTLKGGDTVTIDDIVYTVREVRKLLSGAESLATLSKSP